VPPTAPSEEEFREEVRTFLEATLPKKSEPRRRTDDDVAAAKAFQRQLAEARLAGITWPQAYGGRGLPGRFQQLFDREAAAFRLPPRSLDIGLGMAGPTILTHGSPEQQGAYLPPMLRGETVWCELFSEPGSGSDLASVQTRAVRDGDTWVVDGQKVWTSGAQWSDLGACLTRTDPDRPKRDGITMLVVDMHDPGVTVRPLRQLTGDAHFNEVFLDGARVPAANVIGEVHDGWRVARTMLAFERQTLGAMGSGGGARGGFTSLVEEARRRGLLADPVVRDRLAAVRSRQMVLRHLGAYLGARRRSDRSGGEASLLKLAMAQVLQDTVDLAVDIAGPGALAWDAASKGGARWATGLLNVRSASIGGGTNEVVRNVIAERALGLPRDVEVDLDVPFRELKVGTQREP